VNNTRLDLESLIESLPDEASASVRAWLGGDAAANVRSLRSNNESLITAPQGPDGSDPSAIRTVGVIGGGTAGYLAALALRAKRPGLDITLVESPTVPIIGVGESTVPLMLTFLHNYLGIDPVELYRRVRPTWKLGIRFNWGPDPEGFMAPFDWAANSIGIRGSLAAQGNINAATMQALFMQADRTPVYELDGGEHVSLMKHLPFSYHLDNAMFVAFLTELARERGVRHVDAKIGDVVLADQDRVDHLRMTDGRQLRFDMYVDCTGFRSVLLGKALGVPFHSYADSLFTDSAVTGNLAHGGRLKPYTTATTMDAGWCWTIPTRDSDHLGYVYSSAALSDDDAAAELTDRYPGVEADRVVRFRVGRHAQAWRGNVMAIGNSYAFVEPLESTGLLMITHSILALVNTLPASWSQPHARDLVNQHLAGRWDAIRWFLAAHYRFNTRLDTPFWKNVRDNADASGLGPLLDAFAAGAPLSASDPITWTLANSSAPAFYGLAGIDTILLGQGVPARLLPLAEPLDAWRKRKAAADVLVSRSLPQHEALAAFDSTPRLLLELFTDKDSWAYYRKTHGLF
jgi:tryptophan halogenase